jgi:tetratricopeptide (TPR) repeat protein
MTRRALSLLLAGALLLAPTVTRAEGHRYAVVNLGPADHDAATRLLGLYAVLAPPAAAPAARPMPRERPRPAVGAIQGVGLRKALLGFPADEAEAVAAAEVQRGKALYAGLKRPEAAEAFGRALALYDGHVAWAQASAGLREALTYLLLCHHELGKAAEAAAVAARLRELTDDQRPAGVPEPTWNAYPLVAAPLGPRRDLRVKAPAGATVYLDDHAAGTGPLTLPVGPGPHRVRVEAKGHRVFVQGVPAGTAAEAVEAVLVPVTADAFEEVRGQVARMRAAAGAPAPAELRSLARTLGLQALLVVTAGPGGTVRARWFSTRLGKPVGPEAALTLGAGAQAAEAERASVLAGLTRVAEAERDAEEATARKPDDQGSKPAGQKPLWKKWWFWVGAGVVAALVGGFAIKDAVTKDIVVLEVTRP